MGRIITITSGKGGVGKTSISLNLSLSLASKGFKVCLFDADLGLANVNILTGIYPDKDLESVISGKHHLDEILIKDYQGIDIIPGSSGVEKIADFTKKETHNLIQAFLDLTDYDYFIFDTSAGISSQVISFCMSSHEIILVATCEPTSLTDAYAMLKVLSKYEYKNRIKVIINQVKSSKEAKKAYNQLKNTANRFLSLTIEPLGILATDPNVRSAVLSQTPFLFHSPDTLASKCIKNMAVKLMSKSSHMPDSSLVKFWTRCLSFIERQKPAKKQIETHHETDLAASLSNIESKLATLSQEILDIKRLLATPGTQPQLNEQSTTHFSPPPPPTKKNNIVNFETSKNKPNTVRAISNDFFSPKTKIKPIVRGRLRNPTQDELASWNEYDDPVIMTDKSG